MSQDPIVIVGAARTPMGHFLGNLEEVSAPHLGSTAIHAAIERANVPANAISSVIMGCVLPAGLGQAPARQAALGAGIPVNCGCTTLNKMCGSGMKAVILAHDQLLAGSHPMMIAGGMESMSNAPYLIPKARKGVRLGHDKLIDHLFFDGLEDAYDKGKLMGVFADQTADHFKITRQQQDEFALASLERARVASDQGFFEKEIASVTIKSRKATQTIEKDEIPDQTKAAKIPKLKPAFIDNGTVTAANSSSISDGAAALVLMRNSMAQKSHCTSIATIIGHATHAQESQWFTTAPVGAIKKLLEKTGWSIDDVDLFEINEAFAVVALVAMHELQLPHEKVNIHGGACALGHPIGASGARIIVTLIHALQRQKKRRGIAALCIGGGEATALAIELIID